MATGNTTLLELQTLLYLFFPKSALPNWRCGLYTDICGKWFWFFSVHCHHSVVVVNHLVAWTSWQVSCHLWFWSSPFEVLKMLQENLLDHLVVFAVRREKELVAFLQANSVSCCCFKLAETENASMWSTIMLKLLADWPELGPKLLEQHLS